MIKIKIGQTSDQVRFGGSGQLSPLRRAQRRKISSIAMLFAFSGGVWMNLMLENINMYSKRIRQKQTLEKNKIT
ncbi:MAG: hypothetical protein ACK50E_02610 [Bacteroidota bacterium]|jgi:hypothetical protein